MNVRLLSNILVLCLMLVVVTKVLGNPHNTPVQQTSPCANAGESGLRLPSSFLPSRLSEFQAQLKSFLSSGKYRTLKSCEDKKLRDTGPRIFRVLCG
jgi:hypothetical protein